MSEGYVYIAINESYGERLKIGKSRRPPQKRAKELSRTTGVPTRFHIAFQEHVADCDLAERVIHSRLEYCRINKRREFFEIPLKDAITVVANVAREIGTGKPEVRVNECEIIYSLVLKALAFSMTKQTEEAVATASNALTMWLDENNGYNLYIPSLGFSDYREEDEIIRRFRTTFLTDPIKLSHPEVAARLKYFPGGLAPSDEIIPQSETTVPRFILSADRLKFLTLVAEEIHHPAIDNFISDYYLRVGNEPSRAEYYLRFRTEMYRRTLDIDTGCIAYVLQDGERKNQSSRLLTEAKEIHRISMAHLAAIQDTEERQAVFETFYDLYWSEVLTINELEDELEEAYEAVFG